MNNVIIENVKSDLVAESLQAAKNKLVEFKEFKVNDLDGANLISREVNFFKDKLKSLEVERKKTKEPALETCRRIDALLDGAKKAATSAIALFNGMLEDYEMAERKKREAARIEAGLEQKKAEAEANRIIEEGRSKAEALAKQAAEAGSDKEAQKLLAKAAAQEDKANVKAEMTMLRSQFAIASPAPSKVQGTHFREDWYHKVIDCSIVPPQYLKVDDDLLAGIAKSTKGKVKIEGVEFYPKLVAVKGRRT